MKFLEPMTATLLVSMQVGDECLLFYAGSGIRLLSQDLMRSEFGSGQGKANLIFSHTHWDHILGGSIFCPFFYQG